MGFTNIALPPELYRIFRGSLLQDSFPLVTCFSCAPLLFQYYAGRRYLDLGLFAFGFCIASLYHWCQMEPSGLQNSRALGLSGPAWRTYDITFAQWLLARTFGHIVGASHPATVGMSNVFYALCILGCFTVAENPTLGGLGVWLLITLAGILLVKLAAEGPGAFPKRLNSWGGVRCAAGFVFAFVMFPLPALNPKVYWFTHSMWHLGCSFAYHELYCCLDGHQPVYLQQSTAKRRQRQQQHKPGPQRRHINGKHAGGKL